MSKYNNIKNVALPAIMIAILPSLGMNYMENHTKKSVPKPTKKVININLSSQDVAFLTGYINDKSIYEAIARIDELSRTNTPVIYLLIDSPGGSVEAGTKLVTMIENSPKPIFTVCVGVCASMAAIIHQYGKERLMIDRTALMFHNSSISIAGQMPLVIAKLKFFERNFDKMNAFIAERAQTDFNAFAAALYNEIWIDAEDATAQKFNDKLVYLSVDGTTVRAPEVPSSTPQPILTPPTIGEIPKVPDSL